jgi:hypothetical protein
MASQPVTGQVYLTLNGALLRSKEGATLDLGGAELESVFDAFGRVGAKSKPAASKIECTIIDVAGSDHETDFVGLKNATIQFETDTGNKYLVTGCDVMQPPKLDGGEATVVFEGDPAKKI